MGWEGFGLLLIGAAAIFFWGPSALRAAKQAPKGTAEDWKGFLIPIALVILLVIVLIMAVR